MATGTKDYYKLLGLSKDASQEDIKKAFRRLARKYHPDLNPGNKASEKKFKELSEAYDILSDPAKRTQYDRFGEAAFEGGPGFEGFKTYDFSGEGSDFGGFGDVFSDLFGTRTAFREASLKGADLITRMSLKLEEAFTGVTKSISITHDVTCQKCGGRGAQAFTSCSRCSGKGMLGRKKGFFSVSQTCPDCGGAGQKATKMCPDCRGKGTKLKTETVKVKIPAGVDNGSRMKLSGKGAAGGAGGSPGDLYIEITILPHPVFKREGSDITIDVPVTVPEAVLGEKIEIPTLDGITKMTLPPGTQGSQRFKLKGKGFPDPRRKDRGDEYVNIKIVTPVNLSGEDEELIKNMEKLYGENPRKRLVKRQW
jgi:molecular chaperone DnaJ